MRDVAAEVTETILKALEKGTAPWVRPWSTSGSSTIACPFNGISGRRYNGLNVLLLWIAADAHGYTSPEWLTFRQAQGAGGTVRRGEHGTLITFWKFLPGRVVIDGTTGERTQGRQIPMLRSFTVFNRAQCEGLPPSRFVAPPRLSQNERLAAVEAFVKATGVEIRETADEVVACYTPTSDYIRMPHIGRFVDAGAYYATTLHEMTHWTGHKSRLDRDFSNRFGTEGYAREELCAELGSAFLCAEFGIDGTLRHPEYVANWIQVLRGDKRAVLTASSKAREAFEYLKKRGGLSAVEAPEETETAETTEAPALEVA